MAGEIFRLEAMTNLRVTAERACAAAWNICEDEVEGSVFGKGRGVGMAALDRWKRSQALA